MKTTHCVQVMRLLLRHLMSFYTFHVSTSKWTVPRRCDLSFVDGTSYTIRIILYFCSYSSVVVVYFTSSNFLLHAVWDGRKSVERRVYWSSPAIGERVQHHIHPDPWRWDARQRRLPCCIEEDRRQSILSETDPPLDLAAKASQ